MAMPAGAQRVTYYVTQYGQGVEVGATIAIDLTISGQVVDPAMEAAMGTFVAALEELTPGVQVFASRAYVGELQGAAWPLVAEAPAPTAPGEEG